MLPGTPRSHNAYKRPKKTTTNSSPAHCRQIPVQEFVRQTLRGATFAPQLLRCCRMRIHSSSARLLRRRSIPCTRLRKLCNRCTTWNLSGTLLSPCASFVNLSVLIGQSFSPLSCCKKRPGAPPYAVFVGWDTTSLFCEVSCDGRFRLPGLTLHTSA